MHINNGFPRTEEPRASQSWNHTKAISIYCMSIFNIYIYICVYIYIYMYMYIYIYMTVSGNRLVCPSSLAGAGSVRIG